MLDIKKVREQGNEVKQALARRNASYLSFIEEWLGVDAKWREALGRVETLKAQKNKLAKEIGNRKSRGENADELFSESKAIADSIDAIENESRELEIDAYQKALFIPNIPHDSVPEGSSAEQNVVVKEWGDSKVVEVKSQISNFKTHVELGEKLGILDFEAGSKISGSGFVVYRKAGAKLERALIQFLLDLHTSEHRYQEVSPPFLIHRKSMIGTGQLPKFEEDMYGTGQSGEDLFLAPTAEVPVTNLHRDELLKDADLPIYYAAYTPCFRKEAGSSGRETRGLIRMHQFDKVELVKIVKPENSYEELEKLRENAERVLELLGLPYRTLLLCAGDMGFGAAKCYDIEVWAPGENRYLEVSSCSNFEDFQARRMALRFKDSIGKNRFCHTLNGSGTALARLVVALLEVYQQKNGTIVLPEILIPYLGGKRTISLNGELS
ncbi:MAG: serine--tRNA ligase [Verrucomicrobiae bacterium]|nr:serine--tRNA ligase [Verrucomicrobiae bacterium]